MNGPDELRQENAALRERISMLSAAILRISASLDLDTVLREVVDSARALTGARYGMIATLDEGGAIEEFIAPGLSADERRHMAEWPHGQRFFEHLRDLPGALRLADLPAYLRSLGYAEELTLSKTLQATPMRHRGVHVGNFFLGEKEGGQAFTDEDEEVLVLFASQAATAIANARTHRDEQRARADLEALVDTSPVGVVVFDAGSGRPVSFNREARRIVGELSSPDAPLEQLLEVMTCRRGDGREVRLDEFPLADEFRDAETVRAEEIELSVPDGRSVTTLLNATPIRSADGTVESLVVTLERLHDNRWCCNHVNRLCTWLRFDQHAVGKGFCIGGEAEERAESSVAGFAAVEAKDELIEIGLQMLATQPVVDASRPSFEVGEDLVDPRQDEVSGGLPDDMDIVAIGGDRSVAGPAVGFRDGVGIGGGFDEVSEVGGAVGGDFGQPQAAWDVSVPEFDGADDEHLAVVAASLPSGGRIVFGPEWKAGLVDFHQARQRVALGVDHAGAQLVGEQPSAAVRADTELFLELQGRDAVGVGRHQVGGPEPDGERQLAGVQDRPGRHRGLPAAAGALEGVCFSAQRPSLFMAARGTDEAVRPAHFDQPGGAGVIVREHVLEGEEAVGDLFHVVAPSAGTYSEHSTRSPALTSTSTSGGKLSRPEPCA